ncbi:NitT/TauT family transport system ATP-binding protein [Bradyrhizobium lablabi]|uniref:NitT/TauT family transport system ATP-binding protein n=1 Tax=Bradyrhizobium lablabi TaxID=722472 RepID=A0A1M6SZU6_9BRAD|nr:ATP-binding cassette domain-containing protein [Bradyrhizobium lablabi]SHK50253.1 NitT/TauT family transport system ATP-binding protein [Bradyrhizobium lablabi]
MNDAQFAGDANPLELRIDAKSFLSADGTPVEVVRGLDLRLEAGSFGALIGPSGCGKTTILRIAAGLDPDFRGVVCAPGSGRLGMVFQEPRLLPWRTVEENIRLALPAGKAAADLTELVEILGLGSHLARYPGELSLGLARRTAIARAFAVRPDFLLLDEPFVSLDETVAARLRNELVALTTRTKVTTLFVTHDLAEAIQLADRLFFLSDRPAHIIAERTLPPPRGARSSDVIASIAAEMRLLVSQATADAKRGC